MKNLEKFTFELNQSDTEIMIQGLLELPGKMCFDILKNLEMQMQKQIAQAQINSNVRDEPKNQL
jgi:hypothetical protein